MDAGDLNSGPCTCLASTVLHEPFHLSSWWTKFLNEIHYIPFFPFHSWVRSMFRKCGWRQGQENIISLFFGIIYYFTFFIVCPKLIFIFWQDWVIVGASRMPGKFSTLELWPRAQELTSIWFEFDLIWIWLCEVGIKGYVICMIMPPLLGFVVVVFVVVFGFVFFF